MIDFFVKIKEFAEPSATRFVLEKTGESSTRNDDTELEYLPPSLSRMKLYQQYASTCGWDANTNNIGTIEPTPCPGSCASVHGRPSFTIGRRIIQSSG